MQSRVKLGSFLRGIALGSTALFAALIVPAKAQDAPGQTVLTAARMIDVLTGKTVDFPAIFVGADRHITNIPHTRPERCGERKSSSTPTGWTVRYTRRCGRCIKKKQNK